MTAPGYPSSTVYDHRRKMKLYGTIHGKPCPCGRAMRYRGQRVFPLCRDQRSGGLDVQRVLSMPW